MKLHHFVKSVASAAILAAAVALPSQADHHGKAIMEAVNSAERPAADKERDAGRKPADVLMFAGVGPGMTVLDINAGSGYYSEILARTVGSEGKVYSHNGAVYWAFMKKTLPERYADGRLSNVEHIHNDKETFELADGSVDTAMAVLSYHDYFFTHEARPGGGHEDVAAVLASLHRVMKPGGTVVVIDHVANDGTGPADFDKLHRISPTFVKDQMTAAGFTFAGKSDALANPDDSNDGSPFAPEIRGKTNRFIYKFTK